MGNKMENRIYRVDSFGMSFGEWKKYSENYKTIEEAEKRIEELKQYKFIEVIYLLKGFEGLGNTLFTVVKVIEKENDRW